MNDEEKNEIMIPDYVILALARLLLPEIQNYYACQNDYDVMQCVSRKDTWDAPICCYRHRQAIPYPCIFPVSKCNAYSLIL